MSNTGIKTALACTAAASLIAAVPGVAKPPVDKPEKGHGKGHSKPANYNFKGIYSADGTLAVTKGNSRVRKGGFVGQDVAFDYTAARFHVADSNDDGVQDVNDLQAGDQLMVKARLPKSDPGTPPFAATKVVDRAGSDDEGEPAPVVE
jgi:hypothetical protein